MIYEEILREFQKQNVRYILVGGIAFNLLGGVRNTADMDILVEMSDGNLEKVVKILEKRGFTVRQPVDPMGIADKETRADWIQNKNMKAFNFYKDAELKEVDILIDAAVSYDQAKKTSLRIKCGDLTLPVISIDNLIKMKAKTGRPIDTIDVGQLRKIKKLKKT